ncbi:MAG: hypothetical protein P4L64_10675 [Caulobacteraceae bacterium]|nr:hypothetical protein [Caulobacteraceae bacterium]
MARKIGLWTALAVLVVASPSFGAPDVGRTPNRKQLLSCDQRRLDGVIEFHAKGAASLDRGDYSEASRFSQLGLTAIGQDYDPYVEIADDTGQKLAAALYAERQGQPDIAARVRLRVLDDRTSMYLRTHQCRAR